MIVPSTNETDIIFVVKMLYELGVLLLEVMWFPCASLFRVDKFCHIQKCHIVNTQCALSIPNTCQSWHESAGTEERIRLQAYPVPMLHNITVMKFQFAALVYREHSCLQ